MGMGLQAKASVRIPPGPGVVAVSTDALTGAVEWHIPAPGQLANGVSVWVHREAEAARKVGVFQIPGARAAVIHALAQAESAFKNGVGLKRLPPRSLNPLAAQPPLKLADVAGFPAMVLQNDHLVQGDIGPGRALLLIHGIIDRVYGFALAPLFIWGDLLQQLQAMYGSRVYAFDHPTIFATPEENAAVLVERIPDNVELDILCHSRGGLVARCLLRQLRARPGVTVRNVIFMAAANQGSPLAEHKHLADMLSLLSSRGARSPVSNANLNEAGTVMVRLAQALALGIEDLPGVQALVPGSALIRGLNNDPTKAVERYSFIRANLDATQEPLLKPLEMVSDRGFKGTPSDLVAPFEGVVNLGSHTPQLNEDPEVTDALGTPAKAQGHWHHLNLLDSPKVRAFILKRLLLP